MSTTATASFNRLRYTGIAEGISFLVLLGIAMPLKYFAHLPQAVQVVGWAHGVLFVAFYVMAFLYKEENKKSFRWLVIAGIAALLPLGTFVWEKRLRNDQLGN
jgi:integral membrane protein